MVFSLRDLANAQTGKMGQNATANFVGTWTGIDNYLSDGQDVAIPVQITISEVPKQRSLRFEYLYGTKGQPNYSRYIRLLELNPAKELASWNLEGYPRQHFHTVGLQSFMDAGYGRFTLEGKNREEGKDFTYRGEFRLSAGELDYQWDKSADGSKFSRAGTWHLVKQAPIPLAP